VQSSAFVHVIMKGVRCVVDDAEGNISNCKSRGCLVDSFSDHCESPHCGK
jgi:hypothetical protein